VNYIHQQHDYSIARACKLIDLPRSQYYYTSRKDDSQVIAKLEELSIKKPMEGQNKMYYRIRNEGIKWNHKRIERVYRVMGLNKRRKTRRRLPARVKTPLQAPALANEMWSMDFMHDTLIYGRKFRVLNIIDDYNQEALVSEAYFSISSQRVINILERMVIEHGHPKSIRVDNGPEFIANAMFEWCNERAIHLHYIQPGKPTQNAYIERFNRSLREAVLDANLFVDLTQTQALLDEFKYDYNYHRPHESLGNISPINYKLKQTVCEFF
jgi:putative transposase